MFFIGEKPGAGQTMKLANNFLSATAMVATSEAVVMGVKSGLDPKVMIDVINSGSGLNTASRDKFPRAVLPRSFDFGFATGLMVKDVRLYLDEAEALARRAVALMPHVPYALMNLGQVLRLMGRDDEARACFERARGLAGGPARPPGQAGTPPPAGPTVSH